MGEAKDQKENPPPFTLIVITEFERIVVAQVLDQAATKSYEDRRKRRRVRQAIGIVPQVHVFKNIKYLPGDRMIAQWALGRKTKDNGFQLAEKTADRTVEITGETVDYLLNLTDKYEAPDQQAESLLDIEEKLHAVKDESYKIPKGTCPRVDATSAGDKWHDVVDQEADK